MLKLTELKDGDNIWGIYDDIEVVEYHNIKHVKNYGNDNYVSFDYGHKSQWDIDYGFPYQHFFSTDEKNLFYTKKEALLELEFRKDSKNNILSII